jgi:DNA polymerase III delta subunit
MSKADEMITTLTGNNHFLISRELEQATAKFAKQYSLLAVEKLDGEEAEFEHISEAINNLPFLVEKKLVILHDPSKNKRFNESIEQIISSIPDSIDVVIVESKLDKRQTYFRVLKSKTNFREFNELDHNELARWLTKSAKEFDGELSISDSIFLINRVGNNQQLLSNELIKLLNYSKNINRQAIELLTEPSPQSTVFDLLDAAFEGQSRKVLKLYEEQRQQKVEPQAIMAMISWQLHIFAIIKAAGQRSDADVAKEAKLNPFVVRKSHTAAANLTASELRGIIDKTLELDVRLKSESINADEALKHFLLSLAS